VEHNLFICEGEKLLQELLRSDYKIRSLYLTELHAEKIGNIDIKDFPITICSQKDMEKISALHTPPGILATVEQKKVDVQSLSIKNEWSLALDSIRDPGNIGTIIRLAHWFGIKQIVCNEDCVDIYNPKVVQSSMGSIFHVNMAIENISKVLIPLANKIQLPMYAADMSGDNVYRLSFGNKGLLIIGNESNGLSKEILNQVTQKICIPNFGGLNAAESLNAANACGILLSEIKRNA